MFAEYKHAQGDGMANKRRSLTVFVLMWRICCGNTWVQTLVRPLVVSAHEYTAIWQVDHTGDVLRHVSWKPRADNVNKASAAAHLNFDWNQLLKCWLRLIDTRTHIHSLQLSRPPKSVLVICIQVQFLFSICWRRGHRSHRHRRRRKKRHRCDYWRHLISCELIPSHVRTLHRADVPSTSCVLT